MIGYLKNIWEKFKLKRVKAYPRKVSFEEKYTGKKCSDCNGEIIELKALDSGFILASYCNKCGKDRVFDDKNED